jgi:putative spermidine/putrescine transport system ATP-binding protein
MSSSDADTNAVHLSTVKVGKRYRNAVVLDELDIAVKRTEFVSLLGPSGCGKTTLLRVVAGLVPADTGYVTLAGTDITHVAPHRRNIGVVFQNYALFPHLTVGRNIAFGLEMRKARKADIDETVARVLRLVRMEQYVDRPVEALSGGQQQRIAVARALAIKPSLMLLDEPFSALDRKLRETMQIELKRLLRDLEVTAIFVTHDQDEALVMSDRIAVMNQGRIEQFAEPYEIYARPATPFVLDFVGSSLRLKGVVRASSGGNVDVETSKGRVRAPGRFIPGSPVLVAVRPERVELLSNAADSRNNLELTLAERIYIGSRDHYIFQTDGDDRALVDRARASESDGLPKPGDRLTLSWAVSDTMVYPSP